MKRLKAWWAKKQCQWHGHKRWQMCGRTYYCIPQFQKIAGKTKYVNLCWRCGAVASVGEYYLGQSHTFAHPKAAPPPCMN